MHFWMFFCQAQVQIQSRSIPGPFQIYFKSFQSISIQNQMIWTRSWCYFHCATHHHHHPLNFSLAPNDLKPILYHFKLSKNGLRWHLGPNSCQDDPLSSQTPAGDFVDRGHLDGENDILGRQVLNKFMMQWRQVSWTSQLNICQDDPLSSQILCI